MQDVVYCPGYSTMDITKKSYYRLDVEMELQNGIIWDGYITNWDKNNIFVVFEKEIEIISDVVELHINFENHKFRQKGQIVSNYGTGYGIKFISMKQHLNKYWGWKDFYTIIKDRGYTPNISGCVR
ncbi:MAG: hypothetical protein KAQ98_01725 [Bacteriovoracaceae bacterium]|nr:hypothetical protein [Bacteriovoracaceae bacterium]